ncbi:MAG: hypothetical protein PVF34_13245 [Gammaproteobacteria bacterium]|jgi:hypothetical protein
MADDGNTAKQKRSESKNEGAARYLVPLLGTVMVAALTVWVDHSVSVRAEKERNARLATELFSRREQAESELRKDMFGTILKSFLDMESGRSAVPENLSDRLLKLELLALNFGDALSLGPLFQEINREILTPASYADDPGNMKLDQAEFVDRLESLARRVSDRQVVAVAGSKLTKNSFNITVPLDKVVEENAYRWPADYIENEYPDLPDADKNEIATKESCLELHNIVRQVRLTFSNASIQMKTVKVKIDISTIKPTEETTKQCRDALLNCELPLSPNCEVDIESSEPIRFTLDHFNFPMIDNALLSHNQRFATVIRKFERETNEKPGSVELKSVLFPGEFASLRDRPQLDQAISHLRDSLPSN